MFFLKLCIVDSNGAWLFFSVAFYTQFVSLLQSNLYPTVGLQTPGEVVEANFGQKPFVYDIEEVMKVRICGLLYRENYN